MTHKFVDVLVKKIRGTFKVHPYNEDEYFENVKPENVLFADEI